MALSDFVDKITDALNKKMSTMGILIDLKKAFDTINHDISMKKLEHNGVRGVAYEWMKSYLGNRKQFVRVDNVF